MLAPAFPVPYAELFQLQPQRMKVALFTSTKYKTNARVGLHTQCINMAKSFVDSGAGPNLSHKLFVHPTWEPHAKRQDSTTLSCANKQPTRSEQVIMLRLQIDNIFMLVWFGVVEDLAVDFLQGISSFDRYDRGISPTKH